MVRFRGRFEDDYTTHHAQDPSLRQSSSKIHAGSTPEQWRWVDSANNPADHCSRGIESHEAEKWRQFHNGPDFFASPLRINGRRQTSRRTPVSVHVAALYAAVEDKSEEFDAVLRAAASRGKWTHKLRVIAMLFIAVRRWRSFPKAKTRATKDLLPKPEVTQVHLEEAQKQLVKAVQRQNYGEVIAQLGGGKGEYSKQSS